MCRKLKFFAAMVVIFQMASCLKPEPLNDEFMNLVGVWEYKGLESTGIHWSGNGWWSSTVIEHLEEFEQLRFELTATGQLVVTRGDELVHSTRIMNTSRSEEKVSFRYIEVGNERSVIQEYGTCLQLEREVHIPYFNENWTWMTNYDEADLPIGKFCCLRSGDQIRTKVFPDRVPLLMLQYSEPSGVFYSHLFERVN